MADHDNPDNLPDQHGQARHLAERALRAAAEGDAGRAETLRVQADRTDPSAVADVLEERGAGGLNPDDARPASDEEVAAISRTIQPRSAAPSRAGIGGSGSGADKG